MRKTLVQLWRTIVGRLWSRLKTQKGRNRQTLWGECTEANPKLLLNGT